MELYPVTTPSNTPLPGPVARSAAPPVDKPPVALPASTDRAPEDPVQVARAVEKLNTLVQAHASNLQFSVDEETKLPVIKLVDTSTQEVIRQIPTKEVLAIAKNLDSLLGMLVKQKA